MIHDEDRWIRRMLDKGKKFGILHSTSYFSSNHAMGRDNPFVPGASWTRIDLEQLKLVHDALSLRAESRVGEPVH